MMATPSRDDDCGTREAHHARRCVGVTVLCPLSLFVHFSRAHEVERVGNCRLLCQERFEAPEWRTFEQLSSHLRSALLVMVTLHDRDLSAAVHSFVLLTTKVAVSLPASCLTLAIVPLTRELHSVSSCRGSISSSVSIC
jgi:hypothetical protein